MKHISQSILFLALAAGLGVSVSAAAQGYDARYGQQQTTRNDLARVTRVERMASHEDSYQRQECWNERTSRHDGDYYRDDSGRLYRNSGSGDKAARTLIGALIGGALGNQVGDGRGRTAATIAGAAVGASVGNRSGRDDDRGRYDDDYRADHDGYDRYRDSDGVEVRCRTVDGYARGNGRGEVYRVSYMYGGQSYRAMSLTNPGRTIRVTVDVRPVDDRLIGQR